MKKLFFSLLVSIISICAYANTCTYDGVQVTLSQQTVTVGGGNRYVQGKVNLRFTTDKPTNNLRVLLRFTKDGNVAKEIWVNLKSLGSYDWFCEVPMPEGTYNVTLVEKPGMCY